VSRGVTGKQATFDYAPELRRADTDCALIESTSTALQATRLQLTG
jgi:hypothetical protein